MMFPAISAVTPGPHSLINWPIVTISCLLSGRVKKLDDNSVTTYLEGNPEIEEVYITRPLYWHWFAIELVHVYKSVCMQIKDRKKK